MLDLGSIVSSMMMREALPSDSEVLLEKLSSLNDGDTIEFRGVQFTVSKVDRVEDTPLLSFTNGIAVNPDGYSYEVRYGRNQINLVLFTLSQHEMQYLADAVQWSHALLNEYRMRVMMSFKPA